VIYLDRLQAGVRAAFLQCAPEAFVGWVPIRADRSQIGSSLVMLRRRGATGEPSDIVRRQVPTQATLTVTGDPGSARHALIEATGARWRIGVPADTTDEEFRDEVQAALTATGKGLRVTATPLGDAGLLLEGADLAALHGIRVRGDISQETSLSLATVQTGWRTSRVEVHCYASGDYPNGGAQDLANRIRGSLRQPGVTLLLDEHGLGVWDVTDDIDLTGMSGPDWESRCTFDVLIHQLSLSARPVQQAQSVAVDLNINGQEHSFEVES
jgi:hypothetical protein